MTDRHQLEEQMRQAQKMEALGQLAAGVAHDFNKVLTAIAGYAALVVADAPESLQADLHEISAAAQRGTELTRQLLTFSRKQVVQPHPLDLNQIIAGTEDMLRRLLGSRIALHTHLQPVARLVADPIQLEQVLMNLVVNARDAIADGGAITVESANVASSGDVRLSVRDTGCGMDAATQAHIFEPFFTTKPAGKGTGLGLATAYGPSAWKVLLRRRRHSRCTLRTGSGVDASCSSVRRKIPSPRVLFPK
jgi:signal transduction histidine kinase